MPSWSVHLALAKKANEKLNLNKELFYYGCLIPDASKNTPIKREDLHYYDFNNGFKTVPKETPIDPDRFVKDNIKDISNPLILGYLAHLLADNFYNEFIYTNFWVQDNDHNIIGVKLNTGKVIPVKPGVLRKYKHYDLELYGKYLYNEGKVEVPKDIDIVVDNIGYLKPQFLNRELVCDRIDYLNLDFKEFNKLTFMQKIFKHKYKLSNKKQLDEQFDLCCDYIVNYINDVLEKYSDQLLNDYTIK